MRNEGIAPHRIEVIYNGIPLEHFQNPLTASEQAAIRAECGFALADVLVLQVARLDYLKDHATAIRTIERVVKRHSRVRLLLVGDGPERAPIERLARERALDGHVRFLGERADVPRLLAAADIVLLSSISEGIPLTLIEAMAARRPVVSTSVGGVPEIVIDGQTGLLAPVGDADALAEQILRLANDPARREQMGRKGKERALDWFSERRMHDRYRRLYAEMVTK
jgi:glycosyltransferase involved in cell wall biosynthesis